MERNRMKEIRLQTGMSRQQFGDYLGIPRGTIRNWEQGVSKPAEYIVNMVEKLLKHEAKIHIYDGKYMNIQYYWSKDDNGFHLFILVDEKPVELVLYPVIYVQDYDTFYRLEAEIHIEKYLEDCEADKYYEKLYTDAQK